MTINKKELWTKQRDLYNLKRDMCQLAAENIKETGRIGLDPNTVRLLFLDAMGIFAYESNNLDKLIKKEE